MIYTDVVRAIADTISGGEKTFDDILKQVKTNKKKQDSMSLCPILLYFL